MSFSPRARVLAYLAALHGLFMALAWVLLASDRHLLLGLEALFAVSLGLGFKLTRDLFEPLELARDSARLLAEGDFTTRFVPAGQPQVDELIRVYNLMAERLRAERVRGEERHHFLSRVLEVSATGILVLDFDGRIELANPAVCRLLELRPERASGQRVADLAAPLGPALSRLSDGESRVEALWAGRRVRAQRGHFLDRGFTRAFYVLDELTEELRRSERGAYEKLIRTMSHEVNTTVAAGGSLLESCLAYAGQLAPEDRKDYEEALGVVIRRTRDLAEFLSRFASVFRLPAPRRATCQIPELLRSLRRLLERYAEARQVRIEEAIGEPLPQVELDRAQMEQALSNVLKNAIEAAGVGGRVSVTAGTRGSRVFVEIEDSGPGLSEEVRGHLFTPFFSTKEGGQGIGLTLVQEILSGHRFDYSLDAPPGGPTRFTILF